MRAQRVGTGWAQRVGTLRAQRMGTGWAQHIAGTESGHKAGTGNQKITPEQIFTDNLQGFRAGSALPIRV